MEPRGHHEARHWRILMSMSMSPGTSSDIQLIHDIGPTAEGFRLGIRFLMLEFSGQPSRIWGRSKVPVT